MTNKKQAVYIAGSIQNCKGYQAKFRAAEKELKRRGFIVLNPAKLPQGLKPEAYMPICLAMVEAADILCLIGDDWHKSRGAQTAKETRRRAEDPRHSHAIPYHESTKAIREAPLF